MPFLRPGSDQEQTATVEIDGYEMYSVNRKQKKGGGVALYINKNYQSKTTESKPLVVDNIMESVTVEIEIEKDKNKIISSVYRTPRSCIEILKICWWVCMRE